MARCYFSVEISTDMKIRLHKCSIQDIPLHITVASQSGITLATKEGLVGSRYPGQD